MESDQACDLPATEYNQTLYQYMTPYQRLCYAPFLCSDSLLSFMRLLPPFSAPRLPHMSIPSSISSQAPCSFPPLSLLICDTVRYDMQIFNMCMINGRTVSTVYRTTPNQNCWKIISIQLFQPMLQWGSLPICTLLPILGMARLSWPEYLVMYTKIDFPAPGVEPRTRSPIPVPTGSGVK